MSGLPAGLMVTITQTLTSSKAATLRVPRAQARTARVPNLMAFLATQRVPRAQIFIARVPNLVVVALPQRTLATPRVPSLAVVDPAQRAMLGVHLSNGCQLLMEVILLLVVGSIGGDAFSVSFCSQCLMSV